MLNCAHKPITEPINNLNLFNQFSINVKFIMWLRGSVNQCSKAINSIFYETPNQTLRFTTP